ncbi:MAG: SRPBCC domain-containing protein [Gemmatimonadota bacterium]|nr:SRPBCC domain-containing protein [Gemmatimonadota bacterium]MDE2871668.1 SRPBCC domain-containing protein [Gemmatimonadota bacterium]
MSAEACGNISTRDIKVSTEIAAPEDTVWEAVSTGSGLARWFSPFASVQEGKGGTVSVSWVEGADWPSRITVWEPGRHLRLVDLSDPEAAAAGRALTVDYHLSTLCESPTPGTGVSAPRDAARGHEGSGGKTRLLLVNSGLPGTPDWDEHFHMMTNGWRFFLWNLKHAVERHPGVPRRMLSARPWVTGSREEVWRRLFGVVEVGGRAVGVRAVLQEGGDLHSAGGIHAPSLAVGDPFHFVLDGGDVLSGTVVFADRPWAFAGMVESLNDGVLHVEMEGSGERWRMGVWVSVYGVGEVRCGEVGEALERTIGRLFRGEG